MSRLSKTFLLTAAMLAASGTHAQAPAGGATADVDDLYVGIGVFSDMLHLNVQTVTRWGNFLTRVGQFQDNEGLAVNLSWRKPLEGWDGHLSGFYIGAFGGHVAGETLNNDAHQRLGAGGEIGYHWVKEYTRAEVTVGLGAAEPLEVGPTKLNAEPTVFFSVNWALGY